MICPKCGYDNEKGDKFCVKCGAELKPELLCPKCGAKIVPGERFCGACGTRLDELEEFPKKPMTPPVKDDDENWDDEQVDEDEGDSWRGYAPADEPPAKLPWYKKYKALLIGAAVLIVACVGLFAYMSTSSSSKEAAYVKSAVTISTRLEQNNEHFANTVKKLSAVETDGDMTPLVDSMKKDKQTLKSITTDYEKLSVPDKYKGDDGSIKKMLKAQSDIYDGIIDIANHASSDSAIDKANELQPAFDDSKNVAAMIQIPGSKFVNAGNMDSVFDYLQAFLDSRKKAADKDAKAKAASQVSYYQYTNSRYGYTIDIPTSFTQTTSPANSGYANFVDNSNGARIGAGAYANNKQATAATLYNQETSHMSNATITYTASGTNWYVIAYTRQGTSTYRKVFVSPNEINYFTLSFSAVLTDQYKPIIDHMEPSFHHSW